MPGFNDERHDHGAGGAGGTELNPEVVNTGELNTTVQIDPDTTSLFADVNAAISDLAPEGGKIVLPSGTFTVSEPVDLSQNVNNQNDRTPIWIDGQQGAAQGGTNAAGTRIDWSGLADHAIKCTASHGGVNLTNFSLVQGPTGYDGIHTSGANQKDWTIHNVNVLRGGRYGFNLNDMYGGSLGRLKAIETQQGIKLRSMNAASIGQLIARRTQDDTAFSVLIDAGRGLEIDHIYSESNQGRGVGVVGDCRNLQIDMIYLENNNGSGLNNREVVLGDTATKAGVAIATNIGGIRFQGTANAFGVERLTLDDVANVKLTQPYKTDIFATTNARNGVIEAGEFFDIDTANAGGFTWIENDASGTVSKSAGATTVSGD